MSRQLADGNVGSELNSNCSDHESSTISALRKAEVELMVIRTIHDVIEPVIEPLIRRVVKEEIELVQERILSSMKQNSGNTIHPSEPRGLQLRFLNKLSLPVLTGRYIEGEDGTSVKVGLFDAKGEEVKFGPEASAEVEIVVLREDQSDDEGCDWTPEEFNLKIERERKGNRSLLTGKAFLKLKEGIGLVDKISFTNISDWMSKRSFRLGARIVDNFNGTRVREAKSEPFTLEDCRNKLYRKHYPPSLSDKVWRLKNIGKRGPLVKRLKDGNIRTVLEFLTEYFINHQRLRDILGAGMSDKKLDDTVEHALTCELDDRYLYHNPGSQQKTGVVFNAVGQVVGVLSEYQYVPINNLSKTEKADAQKSVISAFEHWGEVVSYDENSLLRSSSRLPNALSPPNSLRLQGHSGPDVGTSHVIAGISANNTVGTSDTIVGYDPTQPSTSSPGIISSYNSIRTSPRVAGYDPMQPSTSSPGFLPSNNSIGASPRIVGYETTQPSTSSPGILTSNNSIGTSPRIVGYDPTQPSTSSPRILPSNNSIGTSPRIVAYDPTRPSTSSPGILYDPTRPSTSSPRIVTSNNSVRTCPRIAAFDPNMQPSSSSPGVISSTNSIESSQRIAPYDPTQPSTSSPGILPSNNFIGTSEMTAGYDHMQPGTSSPGIYLPGNSTGRISSMDDIGLLDFCGMEFLCEASGALGQVPNHQMFDPTSIIQDFEMDSRRRRWFKAHIVLKFSDHVRKKQRVH